MKTKRIVSLVLAMGLTAGMVGCGSTSGGTSDAGTEEKEAGVVTGTSESTGNETVDSAMNFNRTLEDYEPQEKEYDFYFTYKVVHPWWDAVGMGLEEAVNQYADKGITINYEYVAPVTPSATDQVSRLEEAAGRNFDVVGVDVADINVVTPTINNLIGQGQKVMTFSSSDATKEDGCERIAYVGNTHNYEDGKDMTEALCEKLDYKGKVAILVGTQGAPCHEDRAKGAQDVIAQYPDMEIVDIQYDNDSVEKALTLAEGFLKQYDDLAGIICCNMGNPVGAAQAVADAGKQDQITIVGMDHDQRALEYLKEGVIYCLGVQDCFSMGFDTIQTAIKIADGLEPGSDTYPEQTEEKTTVIYQDDAQAMLDKLYGSGE
ncbi:substrate-binding domain-containing protein [Luxibacter massiliensis]|uniref:substrate-binding domain-containing protein n=1 Tax=Luxibacter massiliensis TaxID=2219695 RepID=UPI000F070C81|nr:substrate-binding domain-containing protein [Luxibacter massiliensis]